MTWERVFTISDYYDGPRKGVANFGGKPHAFESEFNDIEDYCTDRFFLMEIDQQLLSLVIEDWEIWLRWCEAFHRGDVDLKSHPALPADRERHNALRLEIGERLLPNRAKSIVKRAHFRPTSKCFDGSEVQWLEVERVRDSN